MTINTLRVSPAVRSPQLLRSWPEPSQQFRIRANSGHANRAGASLVGFARIANGLSDLVGLMDKALIGAQQIQASTECVSERSRLHRLVQLLLVLPFLRSSQIEAALGVSRIGARSIFSKGQEEDILLIRKMRGLKLGRLNSSGRPALPCPLVRPPQRFGTNPQRCTS